MVDWYQRHGGHGVQRNRKCIYPLLRDAASAQSPSVLDHRLDRFLEYRGESCYREGKAN